VKDNYPDFKPKRILDMGCAAGQSTLAYCEAFPDAEVYAIDLGAPMIRYAHARAEGLGESVHFSQQSAEHTDFSDGYFDLIVSHIMFHETSNKAVPNILRETHRLLSKGGRMVHSEVPAFFKYNTDPFNQIGLEWEAHFNAEPFMPTLYAMDMVEKSEAAGFKKGSVKDTFASSGKNEDSGQITINWYLLDGEK
jgi:ubiquinone/menaquinone biosynthesis C-methylase UbiE